ncbi:hypothetical protein QBC45DRAFT_394392 [Copromyces sp. CBS 386.78]|nr:hypothetical protein QBC45DRAFT_394392 [Copromyces sp. CBS 386.78]
MKPHLREILVKHDDRFTTTNGALMHIHFRATIGEDAVEVPVETLPAGQLGLPLRLEDVEKIGVSEIPILPPELLFITKAKRAAALTGSSRPKSVARLAYDEQDLEFLLRWMGQHGRIIDIHRNCSLLERQQNTQAQSVPKDRLYKQLRDLYLYWSAKEHQGSGQAEAFKKVIATIDQAYFQET